MQVPPVFFSRSGSWILSPAKVPQAGSPLGYVMPPVTVGDAWRTSYGGPKGYFWVHGENETPDLASDIPDKGMLRKKDQT